MAGLAVRGKREVELPGAVLQSSRSCHNSPVSHPTQSVFIHTHHQTCELASNCILEFDGSRCEVPDSWLIHPSPARSDPVKLIQYLRQTHLMVLASVQHR